MRSYTFVVTACKIPEIYWNADESTFPGQSFWRIFNQVRDNKTIMKRDTVAEFYERFWKANGTGYFTIDPIFISILRKNKIVYFRRYLSLWNATKVDPLRSMNALKNYENYVHVRFYILACYHDSFLHKSIPQINLNINLIVCICI